MRRMRLTEGFAIKSDLSPATDLSPLSGQGHCRSVLRGKCISTLRMSRVFFLSGAVCVDIMPVCATC
eukprot:scaffold25182_cov62-Phaeocystis_antarctica.AAC.2